MSFFKMNNTFQVTNENSINKSTQFCVNPYASFATIIITHFILYEASVSNGKTINQKKKCNVVDE